METVKLYLCDVKELKDDYLIAIPFLTELDKENILKYGFAFEGENCLIKRG